MALQSHLNFPIKKSNCGSAKISCDSPKQLVNAKRALFEETCTSPKKKAKQDENSNKRTTRVKSKCFQNRSSVATAKQVFHTGQPVKIIGRSKEISEIENFLNEHVSKHQAASMYISGPPGTGKTSCLMSVIEKMQKDISFAFVNCMTVSNPNDIYASIAREFNVPKALHPKKLIKRLEDYVKTSTSMNVLVLDEIDHLDSKGQDVLYTLFEWPQLKDSSLILIGIANALDLTDRLLPNLFTIDHKRKPTLMHFHAYSREQIIEILEDRLSSVKNGNCLVVKPAALELCAKKIATCTGDIRKALDVCCRAVEKVQMKRNAMTLQSTSDDRSNPGSPRKGTAGLCVDVLDVISVLDERYGSRLQTKESCQTVPLQQKVILCTLLLMKNHLKNKDMTAGKLEDIYKRVCKKQNIDSASWDFARLCNSVAESGFISLKPNKVFRMSNIVLKIDKDQAESLFQDKTLLLAILSDKSVLNRN